MKELQAHSPAYRAREWGCACASSVMLTETLGAAYHIIRTDEGFHGECEGRGLFCCAAHSAAHGPNGGPRKNLSC